MTAEKINEDGNKTTSPALSEKSTSPAIGRVSPDLESMEDYDDPPKPRTRSSSQASTGENLQLQRRLLSISKASAMPWQGESPSQICLCQPDPKVPRPRNAFILYRQHHQATVVSQNPGLANPEISKVIGDHWRSSPPEVKNHWKILADEEKLRHQKQYPDYRYQPRRSGRNGSLSSTNPSTASTIDSEIRRCLKCGGRSITTPGMITGTSFSVSTPPTTLYSPSHPPSTPASGSSAARFLQTSIGSPQNQSPAGFSSRTATSARSNLSALTLASPHYKRNSETTFPTSPDTKRRRLVLPGAIRPHSRTPSGPLTPFPFPRRRESLPRPDFMPPPTVTMGPPPRPYPGGSNHYHNDSSLTLAPLQTVPRALGSPGTTQAKSVEAMVMSISVLNKIRVLAKISPPLAAPGPSSPKHATRGFVIAVEGADTRAVEQMTVCLQKVLESSHPVRVFARPEAESGGEVGFMEYLRVIETYHALSHEIVAFITSLPETPTETTKDNAKQPSTPTSVVNEGELPDQDPPSPKTTLTLPDADASPSSPSPPSTPTVPIALLPTYQLTHTDAFASRIPIRDAYAPVDHWQWMATLWRGIVGADVTVAIRERGERSEPTRAGDRVGAGAGAGPPDRPSSSRETDAGAGAVGTKEKERDKEPEVEVRLEDARAVLVRGERGRVGEGGLRRVGFEVGEWVRGR